MAVTVVWRGSVTDTELTALHAEGFGHPPAGDGWEARLDRHSLGWVVARDEGRLVGFVNVAWDGGAHAFLLDTLVAGSHRRRGIGEALVQLAVDAAREAGCEWLHADWEDHLDPFYLDACGFTPTSAGLHRLR